MYMTTRPRTTSTRSPKVLQLIFQKQQVLHAHTHRIPQATRHPEANNVRSAQANKLLKSAEDLRVRTSKPVLEAKCLGLLDSGV